MASPLMVKPMSGRSLTPEENERVVAVIREMLQSTSQTELARRLGIKQPTVSALIQGRHNAGYPLARRVAEIQRIPVEELLSGRPTQGTGARWRDVIPGWADLESQAVQMFRGVVPEYALRLVGDFMGNAPLAATPACIGLVAQGWMVGASSEQQRIASPTNPKPRANPGPPATPRKTAATG